MNSQRIAIIGAGSVGAAIAYAILLRKICSEVLMVDVDETRCKGEVADLQDGVFLTNTAVRFSTLKEAGQCDLVVISAGAKQREGETRLELIDRNLVILKSVISGMSPMKESSILCLVSNPVDILAYFAQKISGLPRSQVFGSGTFLDTCRLRNFIAEKIGVADTAVHAYVLGEHGDSQFVAWSSAHVANVPLLEYEDFKRDDYLKDLSLKTKNKAYEIIKAKGATYFGIAAVVSSIAESIFLNQKTVRPLSTYVDEYQCYISLPVVLGRNGIQKLMISTLSDAERTQLRASADNLCRIIIQHENKS